MKKIGAFIFLVSIILLSSCSNKKTEPLQIPSTEKINELKQTGEKRNPLYFFDTDIKTVKYTGDFLFEKEQDDIEVELSITKNGELYHLKLESIEGVPEDRLDLGTFYLDNDNTIYKIDTDNAAVIEGELLQNAIVVCSDTASKKETENGQFEIKVEGDKREYIFTNPFTETGYYEVFLWEKGKGLTYYKSGFGAEKDSIELTLAENSPTKTTQNPQFDSRYYIFPNSSNELLTQADLFLYDSFTLKLAKNEIFARKGYLFKNKSLQNYFENMPWYEPDENIKGTFDELNEIEQKNVSLINTYSIPEISTNYYGNFKREERIIKEKMLIKENSYHLSYEEISRNGCLCYKESVQIDLNCDGFLEELTVYFYPDYENFYPCEIEIIDSNGKKYTHLYDVINVYAFINIADFDVEDGLVQFYLSQWGPSYDPCVQIFSFDGEKIICNTGMPGFITSYDGRSKIHSFDEYNINCYYDLKEGFTLLPKENIIGSKIEAACNLQLFDKPFTEPTYAVLSHSLLSENYQYNGSYHENYIGIVSKGTQLEVLDIEFQTYEDGTYFCTPWLKVKTPTGMVGWFHLVYGD